MGRAETRNAVLALKPRREKLVQPPEEGGPTILLVGISAAQRAAVLERIQGREKDRLYQLRELAPLVVAMTARDPETREQLFSFPEDQEALLELDPHYLDELLEGALEVCGLNEAALEDAGNVSAPSPSGASVTV